MTLRATPYASLMAALVVGCTGLLVESSERSDSSDGDLPGGGGGAASTTAAPEPTLRRLTVAQYQSSVADLFDGRIHLTTELEEDTALYGFSSIGAARLAISPRGTERYEQAALEIAAQAANDTDWRASLGCEPAAAVDEACARSFVESFGGRLWRRPLVGQEVERYVGLAREAAVALDDFWAGIEFALAGLLQSPYFLYRVELGEAQADGASPRVLTDFELATRLSYFLWNTTPDAELLAAAESGELSTPAGLTTQAERLLASERADTALAEFFTEMLHLQGLDEVKQSPEAFPEITATLGPSMLTETLSFLQYLVESDLDYRELFTSTTTFVNDELAAIYGIEAPAGGQFGQVTLPEAGPRAGFLGHASFLSTNAHVASTSPTYRGLFVRETLLCQGVPPPPPDVVAELPEIDPDLGPRTARQKLILHQEDPGCASCHRVMDPIGFALEHFDALGRYRSDDQGLPIDATGELDGVAFDGARELGQAIFAHPNVTSCLVRNVIRNATGRLEGRWDEPHVVELSAGLAADGHRVRALLLSLVQSPSFRLVGEPR